LSVFTIKVNKRYSAEEFDDDLRAVMKRAGCGGEKICFIFDEANVLESSFLERMNTLLATGEVPGLFEGDEYTSLSLHCKADRSRTATKTCFTTRRRRSCMCGSRSKCEATFTACSR